MHAPAVWLAVLLFFCKTPQHLVRKGQSRFGAGSVATGVPFGSAGKESASNGGDLGSIPGLGKSPGEGKGYPLQYSGLEYSMDSIRSDTTERLSLSMVTGACYDVISVVLWFLLIVCETQRILAEYNNSKQSHSGQCGLPLLVVLKRPV